MSQPRPFRLIALAAAALPEAALAAAPAAPMQPAPTFFSELVSIVLPLAFIILGLFLVLHFARRRYGLAGRGAALSVVQVLPLGPRERLVLVKTHGGRVLAVGVSSQSVQLVAELDPADLPPAEPVDTGPATPAPKLLGLPLSLRDLAGSRRRPPQPPA